jgi:hypothetical protein
MADTDARCYGVRTFGYDPARRKFHSVAAPGDHWGNGVSTAQCFSDNDIGALGSDKTDVISGNAIARTRHEAPDSSCDCGIYASLYLDFLKRHYDHLTSAMVAVIAAEGLTFVGSRGLRTARARVVAYALDKHRYEELKVPAAEQFRDAKRFVFSHGMAQHYGIPLYGPPHLRSGRNSPAWWKFKEKKLHG